MSDYHRTTADTESLIVKDVEAGQELTFHYGDDYWKGGTPED
jgi:hypothetical protein